MVIKRNTYHIIITIFIVNNKLHSTFYKYTHMYTNTGQRTSKKKYLHKLASHKKNQKYIQQLKKVSEGNTVKKSGKTFYKYSIGICRLQGYLKCNVGQMCCDIVEDCVMNSHGNELPFPYLIVHLFLFKQKSTDFLPSYNYDPKISFTQSHEFLVCLAVD